MKKVKNGFFITVEGIDGSGKSSVVNALTDVLSQQGYNVIKTREPGGTSLGILLRDMILNQSLDDKNFTFAPKAEFLLFAADRAQHFFSLIKPALLEGAIVISDRGSDSSLAYQGYGKGLNLRMISEMNSWIMEDTKPNLVVYLKIDYKTAIDRIILRGEKITSFEKKGKDFFERVIDGFNKACSLRAKELPGSILEIDATQSAQTVKAEVIEGVLKIIALKELC